jgi:hypothetical protein
MDLKTWLDAERGRYTELAKLLDVTVGRVSQMADDGVPPKFMLQVRDFTTGVVTLEEMVKARTPEAPARTVDTEPHHTPDNHPHRRAGDKQAS